MNRSLLIFGYLLSSVSLASAGEREGVSQISAYGYDDCLKISNDQTSVIICPQVGGRILSYSFQDREALPLPKGGEGWTYEEGKRGGSPIPGRFDIGPETTIPQHPVLWQGVWQGKVIGDRKVQVVSPHDQATGIQLIREFTLNKKTSQLECRQTMTNRSKETVEYCYWSRTFALGGGIVVVPLTKPSRFPNQYVMYTPAPIINYLPEDKNIRRRDGFLEILGPPAHPKLGMDTQAGWFAYLMPNDLMFVKQFPVYPDRVYNEVAGLTMSIWYPDRPMVELEPIGPREKLKPGTSASFKETWYLLPQEFPESGQQVDLQAVETAAKGAMSAQ
ncbi:MAG: hypothetical protein P8M30_07310 [Planctomycetaceae bacterium]|jgi:hypothetical protein|nr:hypothetical protein [Planctomycetaceae bacterium]